MQQSISSSLFEALLIDSLVKYKKKLSDIPYNMNCTSLILLGIDSL
jgi:hypothetical protein